jgi:signal transduction histidine kinase
LGRKERIKELIQANPNLSFLATLFILIIFVSFFLQVAYFNHFIHQRLEESVESTFKVFQGKVSDYIDLLETIYQIEFIPEFGELAESKGLLAELVDLLNEPTKRVKVTELGVFSQGKPFLTWHYTQTNLDVKACQPTRIKNGALLTVMRPIKTDKYNLCGVLSFDISYHREVILTHALFAGVISLLNLFVVIYLTIRALKSEVSRINAQKKLQAERDLALLGRMASSFAHELRNSLNRVFLELQGLGVPTTNTFLFEEIKKMLQWLEDILLFQKEIKIKAEVFKAEDFLLEAQLFFAGLNKKGVNFYVESKVEEVCGDRFWLKKALENLLKNAFEASKEGGTIKVSLNKEVENFVLEVFDDGEPLPSSSDKLFEPFFTTKREGFGLGLYLVKKVAEAHGGVVKIIPQEGGKTFQLSWSCKPKV